MATKYCLAKNISYYSYLGGKKKEISREMDAICERKKEISLFVCIVTIKKDEIV